MIGVLICDDQVIVTEGLNKILASAPEIDVVAVAHNGEEALEQAAAHTPDIVLMDLKMPVMNGIIATRKLKQQYPEMRVLVLTTYDDDEWIFDALRAGADGYLLKDTPTEDLIAAIIGMAEGKSFIDPAITGKIIRQVATAVPQKGAKTNLKLNEREEQILKLIAQGHSNADIAERLFLSEGTVRNYTSELFQKLGVSDRTQAAVVAIRHGLVEME